MGGYREVGNKGNRLSVPGSFLHYVYDLSNQLIRVLEGSNQIAEYVYNGAGQRIKKVTQTEARIFHYDHLGHLIAETNQNGQAIAEYIYLEGQLLAMIKPGEAVYYYHNDHLGTPKILTDVNGSIAWKALYTPFGEAVASIETVENPFRFPGQYYDTETGLHYNYFRYYNPQTGRYITPDPIGLEGGINLFAYVGNNPLNYVDQRGTMFFPYHGFVTFTAALVEGYGIKSFALAWQSMMVDSSPMLLPQRNNTQISMEWQGVFPVKEASKPKKKLGRGAQEFIASQKACGKHGRALHTVQELATPLHDGMKWSEPNPLKNWDTFVHYFYDLEFSKFVVPSAFKATRSYLKTIKK